MTNKLLVSAICLTLVTACGQQAGKEATVDTEKSLEASAKVLSSGIKLNNIDKSIRPQDDFYSFANGAWLDKTEIPADRSSYSSFTLLVNKSRKDVRTIIEETAQLENVEKGSDAQKVGDLYRSYMNVEKLNQLGARPLIPEFDKIDALNNPNDVAVYFAETQITGTTAPFGFFVSNDSKDPTSYITFFTQSGLGMPDKKYYFKDDEKSVQLRADYVLHLEKMLSLAGVEDTAKQAQQIMDLETAIADLHWTRIERRDKSKTYHKVEVGKLSELMDGFNWTAYLQHVGLSEQTNVIIREKSYFENFSKLFKKTSVDQWKIYFKWTVINSMAGILSESFSQQNFDFYQTKLRGTPEQQARWKRGVNSVNGILGEVVGKIYVEKHFKPEAKERMVILVENMRSAYSEAIAGLDWMSEETKKQAQQKLEKFTPKIGYPDKWRDYSALEINPDDLAGNYKRSSVFAFHRQIDKLGKPIDRSEWRMSPQTVNAYYSPGMKEIVFPAAILQPPFFNMDADDAVNYGAIGGIIGHEMGHGFDDQGSKVDGNGELRDWWTAEDLEEFKSRTSKLAGQYSKFEPLPGEHIDGEMTLGENIGDLGGLTIAHRAFTMSQAESKSPEIDGLTGEQRFFIGFAQGWATKTRDKALRSQLATDPHSPAPYRGNGTLMNMPEFMKAYDVKAGDGMYRAPEERVKIW